MSVSRIARWAAAAATVAAAVFAGSASAAPKPEDPPVTGPQTRFEVPLTGEATFAELGTLTFAGQVRVSVQPRPATTPDALRIIHTRLEDVVGTGTGVSCEARGAAHFRLPAAATLQFTGEYNLVPAGPVPPGDPAEACWGNRLTVEYTVNLDADGNVVGEPTAVAVTAEETPAP
ncbi:hypothetical protein [Catellatospora sp. NPDC049609]|uniref:hypothetical protein n=1 Tax=Catellatospora sp. NPDC049609 TaxID=3155505 RepID=UPI003427F0CC